MPLPYSARPEVCVFFILHFSVFSIHFYAPLPYNALPLLGQWGGFFLCILQRKDDAVRDEPAARGQVPAGAALRGEAVPGKALEQLLQRRKGQQVAALVLLRVQPGDDTRAEHDVLPGALARGDGLALREDGAVVCDALDIGAQVRLDGEALAREVRGGTGAEAEVLAARPVLQIVGSGDSYTLPIKWYAPIASVAALTAQPLAALPLYRCGVPLAGCERLRQLRGLQW